jgi:2-iminobutanoate/2-iminopropanoate deaminase
VKVNGREINLKMTSTNHSKKQKISTDKIAHTSRSWSQGIKFGDLLFLSGQLGRNPITGELEEGFGPQVRRVLSNLREIVEAAGSSMDMVLKTTIFVTDMSKLKELNAIYAEFFSDPLPARSCVEVTALAGGAEVEIELIAGL